MREILRGPIRTLPLQKWCGGLMTCVMTFFLVAGCAAVQQVNPDSLETELDILVPKLLYEQSVPGVSIAIVQGGTIIMAKGYGFSNKNKGTPVKPETHFQIGSVSKTLTAWGVMKLVERGLVELDAPVDGYLKRWHLPKTEFDNKQVTLRRVLSHTGGLSVSGYHGVFVDGDKLPTISESLDGYIGSDGGLKVIQEPGTGFRYSSGGYTLLQLLIEDVIDEPFASYMQRTIFEPLGMKNSSYQWRPNSQAPSAIPYSITGVAYPHYQIIEQGSGGVFNTTGSDLALFVAASASSAEGKPAGRGLLKPETVRQMLAPAGQTDGSYGLGYKMFPVSKEVQLITHDGANEGFRAMYLLHPQKGDVIVILTNSDAGGKIMAPIICAWSERAAIDMSPLCKSVSR